MRNDRSGLVSLAVSLFALVFILLDFLVRWLPISWVPRPAISCTFLIWLTIELVAIGLAFAARDTAMGKVALLLSLLTIAAILGLCCTLVLPAIGWGGSGVNG